jgi:cobalt/nickel transport system ATP-binding protein
LDAGVSAAPDPAATALAGTPPPSLQVRELAFAYPDGHQALYGVDLTIRRGERVALLGPNGAGKTTLVLHLNGILTAGHGSVAVGGLPVEKRHLREIRRRVGIVFQDPDDQLFLPTVGEDVAFGPANFGVTGDALTARVLAHSDGVECGVHPPALTARVDTALDAVGMREHRDRSPLHLSGGQRRRVALATVLACEPEILVLDEPSTNLDPVARRELAEVLLALDTTILMVTHDLPYALQLCPRSVVLDDGAVVADGPTRELLTDAGLLRRHRLELPYGFHP